MHTKYAYRIYLDRALGLLMQSYGCKSGVIIACMLQILPHTCYSHPSAFFLKQAIIFASVVGLFLSGLAKPQVGDMMAKYMHVPKG